MLEIKFLPVRRYWVDEYTPKRKSDEASCFDLHACFREEEYSDIKSGEYVKIPCGFAMELPNNWEAQIRPRSGLAFEHGVTVLNSPGTIDSDYRGEIAVLLINHGTRTVRIKSGDRIAQMSIQKTIHREYTSLEFKKVKKLTPTVRGTGGFGSTGLRNP